MVAAARRHGVVVIEELPVRRNNVREAALGHDWLYRIQVVFDTLGLPYTDEMLARAQVLDQIAARVDAMMPA
jgi:hypothetical protein